MGQSLADTERYKAQCVEPYGEMGKTQRRKIAISWADRNPGDLKRKVDLKALHKLS